MINYKILLPILFFILFSCNSKNDNNISKKNIIKNKEKVHIKLDSTLLSSYSVFHCFEHEKKNYLAALNRIKHKIDFYNLDKSEYSFSTQLSTEGINTIKTDIESIWVHNLDSIFLKQTYKISLMDTAGTVIKNLSINSPNVSKKFSGFQLEADNNFPIYYKDKKIYLKKYSMTNNHKLSCYDENNESILNIENKRLTNVEIYYPKIYKDENDFFGFLIEPARAVNQNTHIYSFPADPNLYILDLNTNKLTQKNGKSKYQKESTPTLPRNTNSSERKMQHLKTSPFYGKLLYDKYRKLYYRFFNWALEAENNDGTFNSYGDKKASIIIFDNELNIIDEIKLPEHTYSESGSFVGKEGLYLSTAHYKNTNTSENILGFDVYKFEVYE